MWEKVTTTILLTTYKISVLFLFCILLENILTTIKISNMNPSLCSPSPFEIPSVKNANVVKTEINPFLHNIVYNYTQPLSFENEPYSLETIPLIREHLDTYLFYIRHRSTTASTEYPSFQITFPQSETSIQTYRRTINPISLQIPNKEVFHAFLNRVKEHNLALENPKCSPNALKNLNNIYTISK